MSELDLVQRGYIQTCTKLQKTAREIHNDLKLVYKDEAYSYRSVARWVVQFKSDRTHITDSSRSGAPVTKSTKQNIRLVEGLIEENRRITFDVLEELTGLSRGTLHRIVHQDLGLTLERDERVQRCKNK
jgi:hypothetical protein